MAVALWFLVYVTDFDSLFLSNDQRILKQYSTCALAYCAAGADSDEVNAVGCLKYESGRCNMTCAQVEQAVYLKNNVELTVKEVGGREAPHYCGPDAALEFEFSGVSLGGVVPLASGQMDKLANKPQWVCKPIKIPVIEAELDSFGIPTTDIQHGGFPGLPQNCIILSGKPSPIFPGREGCFLPIKYDKSYDSIYFTPIIEYEEPQQIIYPSAIYVDRSFTETLQGSQKPECEFRNSPNRRPATEEEITQRIRSIVNSPAVIEGKQIDMTYQQYYDELGRQGKTEEQKTLVDSLVANQLGDLSTSDGNNLIGNVLNKCNFKTTYNGEKITYRVWAKPVYPTIDALKKASGLEGFQNFIQGILSSTSVKLGFAFGVITGETEEFTKLVFSQLGGSCTAVVLERDLKDTFVIEPKQQETIAQQIKITISGDKTSYNKDEITTFSGTLKDGDLLLAGREVKLILELLLEISPHPVQVATQRVVTDNLGNFVWQTQLGGDFKTNYQITAEYEKVKSEPFRFTVG